MRGMMPILSLKKVGRDRPQLCARESSFRTDSSTADQRTNAALRGRASQEHPAAAPWRGSDELGRASAVSSLAKTVRYGRLARRCCVRFALQSIDLELLAGFSQLRKALLEKVRQQRFTEKVGGDSIIVLLLGLCAEIIPLIECGVATAKPHQGHEVDLLILAERADERDQFASGGIVRSLFKHADHPIVTGVRSGLFVRCDVLNVVLASFHDKKAHAF